MTKYQSFSTKSQSQKGSSEESARSDLSGDANGAEPKGESGTDSLLYLNSNNSDRILPKTAKEIVDLALQTANLLTNYHEKQAFTLAENVNRLFSLAPSINHVGFLTLTFKENVVDYKEASRRFNNLNRKLFQENGNFGIWLRATERQTRGAVHYHIVIETTKDIRTGFDWDLYGIAMQAKKDGQPYRNLERQAFKTANPCLRSLWKLVREYCEEYGFGRSELLPIRSNAEMMSKYVGKYISKHIGAREERDKGMRLITYSQGWLKNSVKISWYSDGSCEWRRKTQVFVNSIIGTTGNPDFDHYRMSQKFTKRWVWRYRDEIIRIDDIVNERNKDIPF